MNKPAPDQAVVEEPGEPVEIKAPENEAILAAQVQPLGESVVKLQAQNGSLLYGMILRNRAITTQSDFFRVQFRGYAINNNLSWNPFPEEEARVYETRNCAWVRVDHPSQSVTFGPKTGVAISQSMLGTGLDEFLFAAVISWCKQAYPEYKASPGMVMMPNGSQEADKLHRQSFYAKQGFEFEWSDATRRSGLYYKDKLVKLIGVCESTFIAEFGGEDMLQTLIKQDQERRALEERMTKVEAINNAVHQALDKERHTTQVLTIALIVVILIGLWAVL